MGLLMFSRFAHSTRSPLEEANQLVLKALDIAALYETRRLTEIELALLKQLRIALLCGGKRVHAIEENGRRGAW